MNKFIVVCGFFVFVTAAEANNPLSESEILAQRGDGVVTRDTFAVRAEKIPNENRFATLRNKNRLRDLINTLLLQAQLTSDARKAGFDKEKVIIERMKLAAEVELAQAWLEHYVKVQPEADYEMLATEYYLLNKDTILTSPKVDVSHILISTEERSAEEALELAESLYQQLTENPGQFDEMVLNHSEDPSAASNKGQFKNVMNGDMVKPFEDVAFTMQEGEISAPVKTVYGYHIMRLDAFKAPRKMEFEEVKTRLIETERKQHEQRVRREYLETLTGQDVKMTEEALLEVIKTQFGEDYVDSSGDVPETE